MIIRARPPNYESRISHPKWINTVFDKSVEQLFHVAEGGIFGVPESGVKSSAHAGFPRPGVKAPHTILQKADVRHRDNS